MYDKSWVDESSLYLHGERVDAVDAVDGLFHFVDWLGESFDNDPVILVAYNGLKFDAKVILSIVLSTHHHKKLYFKIAKLALH